MLDIIKDKLTPVSRQVYYGPNRGTPEWQAKGAFAWGCCPCATKGEDIGGFEPTLDKARQKAETHATTHRAARAVYGEG